MDRRHFLQLSLGLAASSVSWRLMSAPSSTASTRFILVFLRGGYDSLNTVVPYSESFYYESRPTIALAKPDEDDPESVSVLDGRWGLHPGLNESLLPLYTKGQLAFVPFSGPDFISRSHFQSQDWIEFGQPKSNTPDPGSGFLNRLVEKIGTAKAASEGGISFTKNLPPIMHGHTQVANSPIVLPKGNEPLNEHYEDLLEAMYKGHPLEGMAREGLGLRHKISGELREEMETSSRNALPANSFALEAARIGGLLRDQPNYKVGFIDVGGWDTHIAQGAVHGNLANRLHNLGLGLKSLSDELGDTWKSTVVVIMSEFGRTFAENGSKGTDHGHGSTLWVLGGGVKGGAIRGEQTRLSSLKDLNENRDKPVLNENRAVLGGLFKRIYGFNNKDLDFIFPEAKPKDIGLL